MRELQVLGNGHNQFLRTVSIMNKENEHAPAEFIFDAPRPDRELAPQPGPTYADLRT